MLAFYESLTVITALVPNSYAPKRTEAARFTATILVMRLCASDNHIREHLRNNRENRNDFIPP